MSRSGGGTAAGAVRASLGMASNLDDVHRVVALVESFVDCALAGFR